MTKKDREVIEKEFKKIGASLKNKQAYTEAIVGSATCMESILQQLLKKQIKEGEKLGLGKLIGLARKERILPQELLTRLNGANEARIKVAHPTDKPSPPKKKDAEKVYFALAELIRNVHEGVVLKEVCNLCYDGWTRRGSAFCDKCYSKRKEIDNTIKHIRQKINEKITEIRELNEFLSPVKVERENAPPQKQGRIPIETLMEKGRPVIRTRYGRNVLGEPDKYYRQNKIIDELFGKLKKKALYEMPADSDISAWVYDSSFLLGRVSYESEPPPGFPKISDSRFLEKPNREYEEIESLLGKNPLEKLPDVDENEMKIDRYRSLDTLILLVIFYLISSYHSQLRANAEIKRHYLWRNAFLESSSICGESEFSEFMEKIARLEAGKKE